MTLVALMHYIHSLMRYFDRLNHHQWIWVLVGVVLLGLFCMRGFGSRKTY
jgi:hypothetical protein